MNEDRPWTKAEDLELKKARGAHVAWDVIEATFSTARTKAALKQRFSFLSDGRKRRVVKRWTSDEVGRLLHMRDVERKSWPEIDTALGRGEQQAYNKYRDVKQPAARVRVSKSDGRGIGRDRLEAVIADRETRNLLAHTSLTAMVCGDPLPGRSALDQKRMASP